VIDDVVPIGAPCPCGLPARYDDCCGRIHRGDASAVTAEALMRSRYSAFAVGDLAYLARSWHPDTRPRKIHDDPARSWTGLTVLATSGGGMLDQEGTVEFEAHHTGGNDDGPGTDHVVHERSTFARFDGRWVYVGRLP
jgi:SEC-C motif-containing protein